MGTSKRAGSRAARLCIVLVGAWSYALTAFALRIGIHALGSPFAADSSYRLGCVLGIGTDWGLGLLVGLALLIPWPLAQRFLASLVAAILLASVAAGAHYHAIFNRLPTAGTLAKVTDLTALQSSIDAHAPLWMVALECLVPTGLIVWGAPKLAARIAATPNLRLALRLLLGIGIPWAIAAVIGIGFGSGQFYYGSVGALAHVLTAKEPEAFTPAAVSSEQAPNALSLIQTRLAVENAGPPIDDQYPYCSANQGGADSNPKRSAILLILEGVDERLLNGSFQGKPLMPNLQMLARQGVHFERFYAPGYESNQAMTAIFSGLPAVPLRNLLQHAPLARLRGIPGDLRTAGYATAYFHGADLSFEQQRAFLQEVGFEEVIEPDPLEREPVYGWGEPDGVVLDKLRDWVTSERSRSAERPFFATAFTLSTHDPYVWPPEHQRRFQGSDVFAKLAETLGYLDDQLLRFYQWYQQQEMSRGTVLLITGDHAPRIPEPDDPTATTTGEFEYRFRVPLVVLGAKPDEIALGRARALRPAGHHDIPQTLLDLAGVSAPNCYQGRNLFAHDAPPEQRWVVSVAGESLELLYVHQPERRWMLNLKDESLVAFNPTLDPLLRSPLTVSHEDGEAVRQFLRAYLGLNHFLIDHDAFVPPLATKTTRPPLPRVTQPILVAHGGRSRATQGPTPNSIAALETAIADGFQWVEIDLQLTKDSIPVLNHDPDVKRKDGTSLEIASSTWAELSGAPLATPLVPFQSVVQRFGGKVGLCIELKRHKDIFQTLGLAREALKILAPLPKTSRVVIDSFSHTQLATPVRFAAWPVGYDLPQKALDPTWLQFAAERGFEWVYVEDQFLTPEGVRLAHQLGLKVMMYTVNDPQHLTALGEELPDGIQSDTAAPWKALGGRNWLAPPPATP